LHLKIPGIDFEKPALTGDSIIKTINVSKYCTTRNNDNVFNQLDYFHDNESHLTLPVSNLHNAIGSNLMLRTSNHHLILLIGELATPVPTPGVNLTRFEDVFVGAPDRPSSKHPARITPAKRHAVMTRTRRG